MKKNVSVSQIMSKDLITLNPNQSLYDAEKLLNKHKIRHIPIVSEERIVGIISRSDLLRISFSDLDENDETVVPIIYEMYTIPQVMTRIPITIEVDTTIKETAEILARQDFHSIPVVDKGKLVGIVTTTDLINYLLEQYK